MVLFNSNKNCRIMPYASWWKCNLLYGGRKTSVFIGALIQYILDVNLSALVGI